MKISDISNIGALKASGYRSKSIKEELRGNLIAQLKNRIPLFQGIIGYDKTVIPDLERAILSKHNIILLGLRGRSTCTRICRSRKEPSKGQPRSP